MIKVIKKKKLYWLLFFIIYDIIFFSPFIFAGVKTLITPEFYGGDSTIVYYPYRSFLCHNINNFQIPFWSSNLNLGYPIFAEGEIGALNPINIISCLLFDYKTAFFVQIFLHTLIFQIGSYLLIKLLRFDKFSGLYLGIVFPFVPLIIMNYMQFTLILTIFFLPIILFSALKLINKVNNKNFILLTLMIAWQFCASHYQVFFTSAVFVLLFFILYLLFNNYQHKLRLLALIVSCYVIALLLIAVQTVPMIEFLSQSNRSLSPSIQLAAKYDQNMSIKSLLTLFDTDYFGSVKKGNYQFNANIHPWEGNFYIYVIPLIFLIIGLFYSIKKIKPLTTSFLICSAFILLLALGRNSPLYFIHTFPIFSSFRFPSRYNLVFVFIIIFISTIGFDTILKRLKNYQIKNIFFIFIISVILYQSYQFTYSFHVLKAARESFNSNPTVNFLKSKNQRYFTLMADIYDIDLKYARDGYKNNPQTYYQTANSLLLGNMSLIYNMESLNTKSGPQLRRYGLIEKYLKSRNVIDEKNKFIDIKLSTQNILNLSSTKYLLTTYKIRNKNFRSIKTVKSENNYVNIYENKNYFPKIGFYTGHQYVSTLDQFYYLIETKLIKNKVIVEDKSIMKPSLRGQKVKSTYNLQKLSDRRYQINTDTNQDSIMVFSYNYYPGLTASIDGNNVQVYKANFLYSAINLPRGKHDVIFEYRPISLYIGLMISMVTVVVIILFCRKLNTV